MRRFESSLGGPIAGAIKSFLMEEAIARALTKRKMLIARTATTRIIMTPATPATPGEMALEGDGRASGG